MRNALLGLGLSLSALLLSACSGVTPPPPGSGDATSSTASPATSETTTAAPPEPATTSAPATTTAPGDDVKPPAGNKACDKPARKYVAKDTQKCAVIRYFCEAGYVAFHDDCGCGCEPSH